jgi:hypothetical protein
MRFYVMRLLQRFCIYALLPLFGTFTGFTLLPLSAPIAYIYITYVYIRYAYTYIHIYIHTYTYIVHTYIHTYYIHTYISHNMHALIKYLDSNVLDFNCE